MTKQQDQAQIVKEETCRFYVRVCLIPWASSSENLFIPLAFRPVRTLGQVLMKPKDRPMNDQSGAVMTVHSPMMGRASTHGAGHASNSESAFKKVAYYSFSETL